MRKQLLALAMLLAPLVAWADTQGTTTKSQWSANTGNKSSSRYTDSTTAWATAQNWAFLNYGGTGNVSAANDVYDTIAGVHDGATSWDTTDREWGYRVQIDTDIGGYTWNCASRDNAERVATVSFTDGGSTSRSSRRFTKIHACEFINSGNRWAYYIDNWDDPTTLSSNQNTQGSTPDALGHSQIGGDNPLGTPFPNTSSSTIGPVVVFIDRTNFTNWISEAAAGVPPDMIAPDYTTSGNVLTDRTNAYKHGITATSSFDLSAYKPNVGDLTATGTRTQNLGLANYQMHLFQPGGCAAGN